MTSCKPIYELHSKCMYPETLSKHMNHNQRASFILSGIALIMICARDAGVHNPDHVFLKFRRHRPGAGLINGARMPIIKYILQPHVSMYF